MMEDSKETIPSAWIGDHVNSPFDHAKAAAGEARGRLSIPTQDGLLYLPFDKIVRLRADGSYTHVHVVAGQRILTCQGIGDLHRRLPEQLFHRCHHAHLINLLKVERLFRHGGHRVELVTGEQVEVSRRKWTSLVKAMTRLH